MNADGTKPAPEFYVVGGTMRHDAPSYVERSADRELLEGLRRGQFCYVLTSRQMGKSSLMIRTAMRLRAAGIGVAVLDLTAVGQNLTPEQWYAGLILQLALRLELPRLEDELIEFWESQPLLGPLQRWLAALRTVVLPRYESDLVIFIDEIDTVRSLPFPTDEFFAGIRECYNLRDEEPILRRLTFCLLGVATPADLIRDARTTPFNIGLRVELRDFTEGDAAPLAAGFGGGGASGEARLRRILHWSGGHPFLTQRLCQAASGDGGVRPADVDRLCDELFFTPRSRERDDNLLFVRERLLRAEVDVTNLLGLYRRIRRGWMRVMDDEVDPLISVLRLSGIVSADQGRLRVRNRIYARVFDRRWATANLPEADEQRRKAAFRRGFLAMGGIVLGIIILSLGAAFWWQRQTAARAAEEQRQLKYLTEMKNAWREWQEDADVDRINGWLESNRPAPGAADSRDLRGFEWYQLWMATHREARGARREYDVVASAYARDGRSLLVVERDAEHGRYQVTRFAADSLTPLRTFSAPTGRNFNALAFSPDRRQLATDSPTQDLAVWDLETGERLRDWKGTGAPVTAVAWSPDGRWLAVADFNGSVRLLDAATGRERSRVEGLRRWAMAMAFSFDGRRLVLADGSRVVQVLDAPEGKRLQRIVCDEGAILNAAFSPHGGELLTSAADGTLALREARTWRVLRLMTGHAKAAAAIVFSAKGDRVATGGEDRVVRVWSTDAGRELVTIRGHASTVRTLAWAPEEARLFSGGAEGAIKLWDLERLSDLQYPEESVAAAVAGTFVEDGSPLAFGLSLDGQGRIWNLRSGKATATLRDAAPVVFKGVNIDLLCARFSPDGRWLATGGTELKLWDAATGQGMRTLRGHEGFVYAVEASPDGKWLVSGGADRQLLLWEVAAGAKAGSFGDPSQNAYRAVFSPDGRWLASARRDGGVTLWEFATRRAIREFKGHTRLVRTIAFSRAGDLLATSGDDGLLCLWDPATGALRRSQRLDSLTRLAFTPDGRRLASGSGDGALALWDVATGEELFSWRAHTGQIFSLGFRPDGTALLSADADGGLQLLRAATAAESIAEQARPRK